MRIAMLWDWSPAFSQTITWQDGLAAALRELMKRGHEVSVIIPTEQNTRIPHPYFEIIGSADVVELVRTLKPDVILHWADMTRPHARPLRDLDIPMAICFAGGELLGENYPFFDHIFVESEVYLDVLLERNEVSASLAFGTNTDLFAPVPNQAKVFDALMVGTFAAWKRHNLFAQATEGMTACAVGWMYDDHEQECWQVCEDAGNLVLPHVSPQTLRRLYASSRCVVVPSQSNGGSQRTVLEAMAMNVPLIVTDSDKFDYAQGRAFQADPTAESIRGFIGAVIDGEYEMNTRDYVLDKWSHLCYADALEVGLRSIV